MCHCGLEFNTDIRAEVQERNPHYHSSNQKEKRKTDTERRKEGDISKSSRPVGAISENFACPIPWERQNYLALNVNTIDSSPWIKHILGVNGQKINFVSPYSVQAVTDEPTAATLHYRHGADTTKP